MGENRGRGSKKTARVGWMKQGGGVNTISMESWSQWLWPCYRIIS